jgi:hypothetical protein
MKLKRKIKIKKKLFMYTPLERVEVEDRVGRIYDKDVEIGLPIHRDILSVRREGYRTRRPVSIRYKQKRLLALRTKKMWDKQRLQEARRIEMEEYFRF